MLIHKLRGVGTIHRQLLLRSEVTIVERWHPEPSGGVLWEEKGSSICEK
jgi:hypothetical protein